MVSDSADGEHLERLGAGEAARLIRDGALRSVELVEACLARIEAREETVGAWAFLDREHALAQARARDAAHAAGAPHGPLHGVPVGIKDIYDTEDMPTENGTVLHKGRQPSRDATAVALLRRAGAVIMGKTVTAELANRHPGKTRNPHDPSRSPGGSSSGSAAAVADDMVPLALGSQTAGSVIRPAAYCGVYGFKPTRGLISRAGILCVSQTLDQMGVMARSLEDAALAAETLMSYDPADPLSRPVAPPALAATLAETPPVTPRLAFVETPVWNQAEDETRAAFAELVEALGEDVDRVALPEPFAAAWEMQRLIMAAEVAGNYAALYERGRDRLSASLCATIAFGQGVLAVDYNRAKDSAEALYSGLEEIFDRYDAIVTPAATGTAPHGIETTGDPVFCALWTLMGTPALSLPLLAGADGMPMGVQLVGRRHGDGRLLRTARWLIERLAVEG